MEKEKKNLLDVLLERAEQSADDKLKFINIESSVLGNINVKVPPVKKMLEYYDNAKETETSYEDMLVNAQMVYDNVAFLKENYSRLSEAYDEKDPANLTLKIFEAAAAVGELSDIAAALMDKTGMTRKIVKNS